MRWSFDFRLYRNVPHAHNKAKSYQKAQNFSILWCEKNVVLCDASCFIISIILLFVTTKVDILHEAFFYKKAL